MRSPVLIGGGEEIESHQKLVPKRTEKETPGGISGMIFHKNMEKNQKKTKQQAQ